MTFLIPATVFLTVVLGTLAVAALAGGRWKWAVQRRIRELEAQGGIRSSGAPISLTGTAGTKPLHRAVLSLGKRVPVSPAEVGELHGRLMQAGYREATAPVFFTGMRVLLAGSLPLLLMLTLISGMSRMHTLLLLVASAGIGFLLPTFVLGRLIRRRKTRISDALPDTLDLLVVCVEAGLGLNQAFVRVANEMRTVEPIISEELNLVNLEIRAGKPRPEALKNFARRTGVPDTISLVSMILQTDQFGTSVATALRVFSDGMRTKRRQRAEEAAAKTTIKMVFPLVLCILPSLFVVVLGPGIIKIIEFFVTQGFRP